MARAYEGLYFDMPLCLNRPDANYSDEIDLTNIFKGVSKTLFIYNSHL